MSCALLATLMGSASASAATTSYAAVPGSQPTVDTITGGASVDAPWNNSQGVSSFDGLAITPYPSDDLLPSFSFAGQATSATPATNGGASIEPNVAVYPAQSGNEPFGSGFGGSPGPLSGYCGTSYSDSWDTATPGVNPNETATPVAQPSGETLPFSPYYFPYVVRNADGSLTGYFDWRPKDADEAIVVAKSTDGGQTWTAAGEALEQNPGYCPSADTNDDGEGHPYVATLGSNSYLYTLQRANGDYPGSDLGAFAVDPSATDPLSTVPATTSVGVDPNTFATTSTPLPATGGATVPVSTLGGDATYGNATSETDSGGNIFTDPDPSALPTGAAQYEDLTQGTAGQQPPVITCTGTSGTNANSPALIGCTNPQGITVGANDDLVEVIGTAQAVVTDSTGATTTTIPHGPQNEADTLGTDITLNPTSANTNTLTYLLNANAPNRYYINGETVYCSQANAEPTTKIETCTTTDSSGVSVTAGSTTTGTPVIADPVIASLGPNYTGGPVTQTNGLISPDGIIGPLPDSANSSWTNPATGQPYSTGTGHVVLYTEKIANYFVEGAVNGTETAAESATYTNDKTLGKTAPFALSSPQTGSSSTLETGYVYAPGSTATDYNISPFPTESETLPASGSFNVYVGAETGSGGAELDTLTCTGWDVNTHINDLYNPSLHTIDLLGCTGGPGTGTTAGSDILNAGHQGNWVAGPGAAIETNNSHGVSVLGQIGEGKAVTAKNAQKLFGNNEDYEVVRAAYTTDGVNFTDLGLISGSTSGAPSVGSTSGAGGDSGAYSDISNPYQQDAPAGGTTAAEDASNPQGDSPTSLAVGSTDTVELRWPGARGTLVTNPDGSIGLFLSGAWASDGDSDAFNQIFYTQSADGGKTWSVPTVVLSTDYTFAASIAQDQALANGSDPALDVSAYYEGRAYDPTVVQNANGTATLIFAGYRVPNPVKAAGNLLGINPTGSTSTPLYCEGISSNGCTDAATPVVTETDPALYRSILTETLQSSTSPAVETASSLSSSASPVYDNTQVTYTDTITVPSPGTGIPTGSVSFDDGDNPISGCQNVAVSGSPDTATCTTTPSDGTRSITATYSGDSNYASSDASLTEQVNPPQAPTATISAPAPQSQPYSIGQLVATSFSCADGAGGTGIASCSDGTSSDGTGALNTSAAGNDTYTVTATSNDSLTGSASLAYTVAAPPTVSLLAPLNGGVYAAGSTLDAAYTCADGTDGTGIASCTDSENIGNGDPISTSTPGQYTLTVTATSNDGQSSETTVNYTIAGAPSIALTAPVNDKAYALGATVDAKYTCTDGSDGSGIASCSDNEGVGSGHAIQTGTVGSHSFTVTATSRDGLTTTATVTYVVGIANVTPASVSGSYVDGQTLHAKIGTFKGASALTYVHRWLSCATSAPTNCQAISDTTLALKLTSAEVGQYVYFTVTATDASGQTATSATTPTLVAAPPAPVNTKLPVISGTVKIGKTLKASSGTWSSADGAKNLSYGYQWELCVSGSCSAISGATGPSYTLGATDAGKAITVVVTATDLEDQATSVTATPVDLA